MLASEFHEKGLKIVPFGEVFFMSMLHGPISSCELRVRSLQVAVETHTDLVP